MGRKAALRQTSADKIGNHYRQNLAFRLAKILYKQSFLHI